MLGMRYGHIRSLDGYNRAGTSLMKYLTLCSVAPTLPGDLYDDGQGGWILMCPKCGQEGILDHTVSILGDSISIIPSVECGYDCGFHEVITGWELRRK